LPRDHAGGARLRERRPPGDRLAGGGRSPAGRGIGHGGGPRGAGGQAHQFPCGIELHHGAIRRGVVLTDVARIAATPGEKEPVLNEERNSTATRPRGAHAWVGRLAVRLGLVLLVPLAVLCGGARLLAPLATSQLDRVEDLLAARLGTAVDIA